MPHREMRKAFESEEDGQVSECNNKQCIHNTQTTMKSRQSSLEGEITNVRLIMWEENLFIYLFITIQLQIIF